MLAVMLVAVSLAWPCGALLVNTDTGPVNGFSTTIADSKINVFHGIPYAMPPVGNLRFQFPKAKTWTEQLNATSLPNSCYQNVDTVSVTIGFPEAGINAWNANTNLSEDCLYLNIWSPADQTGLPVLLWIYGGGFAVGTSTLSLYDGLTLAAEQKVVVASIQYRVNAFGFLYLNSSSVPGNAGLADQQFALQWIHRNIAVFGGDASRITLFGESAGAASTNHLLLINYGKPQLFQSVILQSGSSLSTWAFATPSQMLLRSTVLAECLGCSPDNVACLQTVDVARVMSCQNDPTLAATVQNPSLFQFQFVPTVDYNGLLPQSPVDSMNSKKIVNVPMMMGVNQNEGSYFIMFYLNASLINYTLPRDLTSRSSLISYLKTTLYPFPTASDESMYSAANEVADTYLSWSTPCGSNADCDLNLDITEQVIGDGNFKCPLLQFGDLATEAGIPIYFYLFNQRASTSPWPRWTGVQHGDEIQFVFGQAQSQNYTASERKLSWLMQTAWANFAKAKNPNVEGYTSWPTYSPATNRAYVNLNALTATSNLTVSYNLRQNECKYLAKFPQFNQYAWSGPTETTHEPATTTSAGSGLLHRKAQATLLVGLVIALLFR